MPCHIRAVGLIESSLHTKYKEVEDETGGWVLPEFADNEEIPIIDIVENKVDPSAMDSGDDDDDIPDMDDFDDDNNIVDTDPVLLFFLSLSLYYFFVSLHSILHFIQSMKFPLFFSFFILI